MDRRAQRPAHRRDRGGLIMGIGLGLGLGLGARRRASGGAAAFDPMTLLSSGELGVWYDPVDLPTMYTDTTGMVNVASAGQQPAIQLDKSRGLALGAPRIDGSFSSATGWPDNGLAGWNITGGQLIRASGQVTTSSFRRVDSTSFQAGKFYRVSLNVIAVTGEIRCQSNNNVQIFGSITTTGQKEAVFYNASAVNVQLVAINAATCTVDDLVIREISGYHSIQSTAANRPTYQIEPSRLVFDGTDIQPITFPSSLGSSCTVARSVPGVGAEILTAQTIGTSYNITQSHAGVVVIDRALTGSEASALTTFLDSRAFF